ncbi:MAG: DNA polymerase III subunit alpha [Tenericutes bacterium]|nr:DNA polymerase III subunit alpha [Mycoplasmatota bacterium]
MINFNLFVESTYSMNGSLLDVNRLVDRAKELGYKTLALVDQNHMYGALKFYKKCLISGIKPIIGLGVLLESDFFGVLEVVLLSKSNLGYKNLIQISSYISEFGKISIDALNPYSKDVIVILRTDTGQFSKLVYDNQLEKAKEIYAFLKKQIKETYLGLDVNDYAIEMKVAPKLDEIGESFIINKVQYLNKEDKRTSTILSKILKEEVDEVGLFQSEEVYYHFKELNELDRMYSAYPKAIRNTLDFISATDLVIDFKTRHLPKFPMDEGSAYEKLVELSSKGLTRRLMQSELYKDEYSNYKERLDYELGIVKKMGYEDYFLIVWDFVLHAKKSGILVGPGRGSAAGSLVAYVLGIVDVDPLQHDLYFERFLNPERITMPDIDMDFPDDKREEVIQYVINKYGKDKVVSIITFGTFQGKSAIRDVGRILEIDTVVLDELSKNLAVADNSIEVFRKDFPKEYQYYTNIDNIKELVTIAEKITGLVKHISTHAAGIIISGEDIKNYSPTQPGLMGAYQTQYEASDLEEIGLLKFDFLGIRNLSLIKDTLNLIKKYENKDINIYRIPLDDKATFDLLKEVRMLGVFQLESEGMMDLAGRMQLAEFSEIATCISLYRPGPMENIPSYLRRRNNEERITYPHLDLMPILKSTNGIIIYQEQIMEIASKFAGYSLGEADVLRRAVSKKKKAILEKERKKFVSGSIKQGYSEEVADVIYDYIVKFANYGFNKSHAVAYALVGYWMAYLKANYPMYFLSVLLDAQIGSVYGTKKYIMECQKMGLKILPPRINKSGVDYVAEGENLRFPIKGIKGIGPKAALRIVEIQEEKEVTGLVDFITRRMDVPMNIIEAMIYAGAFDDFKQNKKTMIENLPKLMNFVDFNYQNENFNFLEYEEYDYETLHTKEKELIGINFQYHIIHKYDKIIGENNLDLVSDILESKSNGVYFVGMISRIKTILTKKQEEMAFVEVEDVFNQVDCVLFPNEYTSYMNILKVGQVYLFSGQRELRRNKVQVILKKIERID